MNLRTGQLRHHLVVHQRAGPGGCTRPRRIDRLCFAAFGCSIQQFIACRRRQLARRRLRPHTGVQ
jgi:hypothetical protein